MSTIDGGHCEGHCQVFAPVQVIEVIDMLNLSDITQIKGIRFPCSVIGYAVWAYHRFALSLRDVEDLLAARRIVVSYETIRDCPVSSNPLYGLRYLEHIH